MNRVLLAAVVGVVAVAAPALAGLRPQAADSSPPDTLRVSTRLVQIDVVVRGDDGPVEGLSIDDFTVYDDGVVRTLTTFDVVRASDQAPDPDPVVSYAEGVISNRPRTSRAAGGGATILLFDRVNMQTIDQPRATDQARKFLESLDGTRSVAIYELNRGLELIQDYTRDRDTLLAALATVDPRVSGEFSSSLGEGASGGFEASRDQVGRDLELVRAQSQGASPMERGNPELDAIVAQIFLNDRIRVTSNALEAVAGHLAPLPGRKSVVWLAGSFPFSFEPRSHFTRRELSGALDDLERAARVLTDSNVALYPVSVVGLLAPEFNQPSMAPGGDAGAFRFRRRMSGDQVRFDTEPDVRHVMNHIADFTGGEAFYLTNGIAEAIEAAVDDSAVVYTLGFSPEDREDRDFHELRVVVAGDGVDVQHRAGYYGFGSPAAVESRAGSVDTMVGLLTSPMNATGIEVISTRQTLYGSTAYVTVLSIRVDDVALEYRDSRWTGVLEIGSFEVDASGDVPNAEIGRLDVELSDEAFAAAREEGLEILRFVNGSGVPGWLRFAVRDTVSGSAGSFWVPLD